jgi:uncharacterized protein (TIGR02284 family)
METVEKSVEVLNGLIELNNDRIAGYAHATRELGDNDIDLKAIFQTIREESRMNVEELGIAVSITGGDPETETSSNGYLHRVWADINGVFTGHDRKGILTECELGEDAIKRAYQNALVYDSNLSAEFTSIVSRQQQEIMDWHDKIKALRDSGE